MLIPTAGIDMYTFFLWMNTASYYVPHTLTVYLSVYHTYILRTSRQTNTDRIQTKCIHSFTTIKVYTIQGTPCKHVFLLHCITQVYTIKAYGIQVCMTCTYLQGCVRCFVCVPYLIVLTFTGKVSPRCNHIFYMYFMICYCFVILNLH